MEQYKQVAVEDSQVESSVLDENVNVTIDTIGSASTEISSFEIQPA